MNGITHDHVQRAIQALKSWSQYLINPKKLARISGLTSRQAGSVIRHLQFVPWNKDANMHGRKQYYVPKEMRA